MTNLLNLTNNLKVLYHKNFKKKIIDKEIELLNHQHELQLQHQSQKQLEEERTYENCCKESKWFDELRNLVLLDQKYLKINEIFKNLNLEDSNCGGNTDEESALKEIYENNDSTNINIEENDKILLSCVLSKLSYLNDKEAILQYLHSQISVTHVLEKIRKLYYFKPVHTRTKVLIAFDNQDNCYCTFNGTVNSSDLILDISCGFLEKIKFDCDNGVKHHLYSDCNRFEWAVSIVEDLLSLVKKLGKKSLIFSGHSMGSTFATFACFEAIKIQNKLLQQSNTPQQHQQNQQQQQQQQQPTLKCYSFGSPSFLHPTCKSFLDNNQQYNQIFENYLNEYDIVPMMSHYPFIFIDFMYIGLFISTFLFTFGYHLTSSNINQSFEKMIYNLVYPLIMLTIPLFLTKLMYIIYQYFYSNGLQSKNTRVFNHKSGRFIFYESLDTDVEFNFRSIVNHVKKLYNYKKLLMIDDHKLDRYLKHLYNCYQNNSKGSNPINILKSDDIVYLTHSHMNETVETSKTIQSKKYILKKGLTILLFTHLIWLLISIPFFYHSLYYLCFKK